MCQIVLESANDITMITHLRPKLYHT